MPNTVVGRLGSWYPRALLIVSIGLAACSSDGPGGTASASTSCSIPRELIRDGGPGKDGIPALSNPELVQVGGAGLEYLRDSDRVIGLTIGGETIAIPLNILWWHEIVNLDVGGRPLAVTHCPLTGSSLAFDRAPLNGAELGVSGLLFLNNLIMYDRRTDESLWPQMARSARCGPGDGTDLTMVPILEMTWAGWRALHPDTRVVSSNTGFPRNYQLYPYGNYAVIDNPALLFPVPLDDRRRPPKERVLGIPGAGTAGIAIPFGTLAQQGTVAAVSLQAGSIPVVVFWSGDAQAAMAFRPEAGGSALTFEVVGDRIVDRETGSTWSVAGVAISGSLAGTRLSEIAQAYVAYWFAWVNFHPETELWTG